jgi:hypothetical protein
MVRFTYSVSLLLVVSLVPSCDERTTVPVETAEVAGRVVDAVTGAPLGGALVDFGGGRRATSAANGSFAVRLPLGSRVASVSRSGYVTSTISRIAVAGGDLNILGDLPLSPTLSAGQMRIVLSWGEEPEDLDAHLTGPVPGTSDRFHVAWWDVGSLTRSPFAELQLESGDGYGPETITISQRHPGTYRFSVFDFTNMDEPASTALGASRASVRLYTANGQIAEFFVPQQPGTLWTVFELNGATGSVLVVDQMRQVNDDRAIESREPGSAAPIFVE